MLTAIQVIVSIILISLILIQERGGGVSALFGGSVQTPYHARRGVEKLVFSLTIVAAILFLALALLNLVL